MKWRLAKSLDTLRDQINAIAPSRSKSSDGTIGDAAHASRTSDHNPWVKDGAYGVVTALDITHDPAHGVDSEKLAEALRASKDARVKYIISNRKIASSAATGGKPAWAWRPYNGSNPHNKHVHVSVKPVKDKYDSTAQWQIELATKPHPVKVVARSKIATGAMAVGTGEAVDGLSQVSDAAAQVAQIKGSAEQVGLFDILSHLAQSPRFWFAVAVVIVAGLIIYWRWRDHG